jgi:predicted nucleotidyltransferase
MNRQQILQTLKAARPVLAERFGVTPLALFGSTARGEARPDSGVYVVVGFDGPATSTRYFGVQFYLEDALGCAVDLVKEKAMRPDLKPFIEREAVNV